MKVLSLGYGKHLFSSGNIERERLSKIAFCIGEMHHIVFSKRSDNLTQQNIGALFLYPTKSKNKIFMLYDAYKYGKSILDSSLDKDSWVITTQDPFETGLVGYLLAKKYKIPLNIQEHGDVYSSSFWKRESILNLARYYFGKIILRKSATVRVVSKRSKETMIELGVNERRICVLPVQSVLEYSNSTQKKNDSDFKLLSIARFVKQKNILMLLNVFRELHEKYTDTKLILVGDGPLKKSIHEYVEKYNLLDCVDVIPWTNHPEFFLAEADLYVLSSNYEGWGRVLIESMQSGLPAITTDVGCVGEVFVDNRHGLVVPVGDGKLFLDSVERLYLDPAIRHKMSQNAKQDVEKFLRTFEEYSLQVKELMERTKLSC